MYLKLIALVVVLLLSCQTPALAEMGWVLYQHSTFGSYYVYINKNAVRAKEVKTHYSILSKAPKWDVYAFRDDEKIYCKVSFEKWMNEGTFSMSERSLVTAIGPKSKQLKKTISGLKYLEYTTPLKQTRSFADGATINMTGFMSGNKKVTKIHTTHTKYLVSPAISNNPKIAQILASLFVVPYAKASPIKYSMFFDNGYSNSPLTTTKIRQIKLDSKLFKIPEKYKVVENVQRITTGHRAKDIDSMIIDLGLGNQFGKSKKKSK